MGARIEIVLINSTQKNFVLSEELIECGSNADSYRVNVVVPKGIRRYNFKANHKNVLRGEIHVCEQNELSGDTEIIIKFHYDNFLWSFDIAFKDEKVFKKHYTVNAIDFVRKDFLSLGVAIDRRVINNFVNE